jgi:hypothetical protein
LVYILALLGCAFVTDIDTFTAYDSYKPWEVVPPVASQPWFNDYKEIPKDFLLMLVVGFANASPNN